MQINCPRCKQILEIPENIYQGGCPKCSTQFTIRKGKTYEESEIVNNLLYTITVLAAALTRLDKENNQVYANVFENFIKMQTLTKKQFDDIHNVFNQEQKGLFHENSKKTIISFKNALDYTFRASPMTEQQATEDNVLRILIQVANCTGKINPDQQKILTDYTTIFEYNEERKNAIFNKLIPKKVEKNNVEIEMAFTKIAANVTNSFIHQQSFINELIVAFKRTFFPQNQTNVKSLATILTNEDELVFNIIEDIVKGMKEEVLMFGELSTIDCSKFNEDSSKDSFLANLTEVLQSDNEIILFNHLNALSNENLKIFSDLIVSGKLSSNPNITPKNKTLLMISSGSQEDFFKNVGEKFYSFVTDVVKLSELTPEEIEEITKNYTNNFLLRLRNELQMNLLYDKSFVPYLASFYNKNFGMKSIITYVEHNVIKPIKEYKIKKQPDSETQIILALYGEKLSLYVNEEFIPLEKLMPKQYNANLDEVKEKLQKIIGLDSVKEYVLKLEDNVTIQKMRQESGLKTTPISMNMIFTGNPGTGKTTIARIVAEFLKVLGVISKGQLVEVSRNDLVAEYQGQTAAKAANVINSAIGGVLFIDEAYSLYRGDNDTFGLEAIDTLVKMMEDNKNDLVVILAGYAKEMDDFLKTNSGLKSRFQNIIDFPDYTPQEMYKIAVEIAKANDYIIDSSCIDPLISFFSSKANTGNGRLVRNVMEKAILNQSNRIVNENDGDFQTLKLIDFAIDKNDAKSLDEIKKELEKVIGLDSVKEYVLKLEDNVKAQKKREEAGFKTTPLSMNMIFTGNPGTGKTTIARIVAKFLKTLGVISQGQMIECARNDLISEYQGQTAQKTADVINRAIGGVLFIDEAYALYRGDGDTFGLEAIDTLVKMMEDNKNDLVVILAGYSKEMSDFLKTNSGLKSRFQNIIDFPDYTPQELYKIATKIANANDYIIDEQCMAPLLSFFSSKANTGNGRLARNVIEKAILNQSNRIIQDNDTDFETLKLVDFEIVQSNKNLDEIKEKLEKIIGLGPVKEYVLKLEDNVMAQKRREGAGLKTTPLSMNMIFTGNPGTGKTTIARIVAEYLNGLGVISKGQMIECSRNDLISEYQGLTAQKTADVINRAIGGVLFIDEAYALYRGDGDTYGLEAIDTIVKMMEDNKNDLVVILAGYSKEMGDFLKTNSGLKSRFPNIIDFPDYTPEEMYRIALGIAKSNDYEISEDSMEPLIRFFESKNYKGNNSAGNGRLARNTVEKAILNQSKRIVNDNDSDFKTLKPIDFELEDKEKQKFNLDERLDDIIGLDEVKTYIKALAAKIRVNREREKLGLVSSATQTLHMIFKGNPGTGKTMMARTVADLLYNLNVINTNNLVETDRAGLVAGYVGQTATKTTEKVLEAMNGVLFIDEAYTLAQGGENDFGREAIDTLLKLMDDNRDKLVVILAGYSDNMQDFLDMNPGLVSRFPNVVEFADYSLEQLMHIGKNLYKKNGYELTEDALVKLESILDTARSNPKFGNGRYVRNVFEKSLTNQALRISTLTTLTKEDLITITSEDIVEM